MKKRNVYDMGNYSWASCRAGELIPLKCMEVLPDETYSLRSEAVIRLDALDRPAMHPLKVKLFHFYCANRQVWPNWNNFITQGAQGTSSPVRPYVDLDSSTGGLSNLSNRLGLPKVQAGVTERVSALPFAHFWNIYSKYFTDHAIQGEVNVILTDGDNTANVASVFGASTLVNGFNCPNVNWTKDYFNTCRVDPELGGSVPIPQSNIVADGFLTAQDEDSVNHALQINNSGDIIASGTPPGTTQGLEYTGGLEMDESATMRDLSIAGALQIFRENRAEWGSRIIDYLRKAFGSKISSYELQEPILLGYGEKTIRFSEVLQTAEGTDPVGTLRGHGIGGFGSNKAKFTVPENGYIITLASVMPIPAYIRNAERHWFKESFMDYFQPEFAHIGNMAVKNKEIAFGVSGNEGDFGYNNPYDDYRRCLNTISGSFADTDKNWHMAREFGAGGDVVPILNPGFLVGAPTQRIFSDTTGEVYKIFAYHDHVKRSIVPRFLRRRIL